MKKNFPLFFENAVFIFNLNSPAVLQSEWPITDFNQLLFHCIVIFFWIEWGSETTFACYLSRASRFDPEDAGCIQNMWTMGGLNQRLVIFYKLPTGYISLSILSVNQSCMSNAWSILTNQSQALNLDWKVIDSIDLPIDNSLPSSLANRYHSDI